MSQRSEKLRRQVERLKERVDAMERRGREWEEAEAEVRNQDVLDTVSNAIAQRRRTREAEHRAEVWKRTAYAALVAAIVVEIVAIMAIFASAEDFGSETGSPAAEAAAETVAVEVVPEEAENENIEAALLAKAHVIEGVTVTHYDCCVACCGKDDGITYTGVQAVPGVTVAVDPAVIPLGSDVLVDYGDGELHYYRADDIGGGIKGSHIDLCVATHDEALQLGRQTATVYWVANG